MVYAKLALRWQPFHEAPAMQQWNCDVNHFGGNSELWFHWLYSNNKGFIDYMASQWNLHCHFTTSKPSLLSYNQWNLHCHPEAVKPFSIICHNAVMFSLSLCGIFKLQVCGTECQLASTVVAEMSHMTWKQTDDWWTTAKMRIVQ